MTPKIRRWLFGACATVLTFLLALGVLLAADLYAHARAERSAGLNRWGYRGPVVSRKRPNEIRVAVLGGSTVFGYGVTWNNAFPALLELALNKIAPAGRSFSVVNLGYNSEGAYSFHFTLEDFAYLDYDIVCLYEGYNDMLGDNHANLSVYRHESPIFRLTGYFPILPLVMREKAMAMRAGGDIGAAYENRTVFRPNWSVRIGANVLEAVGDASHALERQLELVSKEPPQGTARAGGLCEFPWNHYCTSMALAVDDVLGRHRKVLVVQQPLITGANALTELSQDQQRALAVMLMRRYQGNPDVGYADLHDAVDLTDRAVAPDGMHLNYRGNVTIASRLAGPVLSLAGGAPAQAEGGH